MVLKSEIFSFCVEQNASATQLWKLQQGLTGQRGRTRNWVKQFSDPISQISSDTRGERK